MFFGYSVPSQRSLTAGWRRVKRNMIKGKNGMLSIRVRGNMIKAEGRCLSVVKLAKWSIALLTPPWYPCVRPIPVLFWSEERY